MNALMDPIEIEAAKEWVAKKIEAASDVKHGALLLAVLHQWQVWITERPDLRIPEAFGRFINQPGESKWPS